MLFKQSFSGIEFREKNIAIATVTMDRKKPVLKGIEYRALNTEIFQGGRVSDRKQLKATLKEILAEKKYIAKHAHLAIPTQHVILRKINSLPDLAEKVLGRLLDFQIGESIHLPFDNPIYDYKKLGTIAAVDENQETRSDVLFIATSRDLSADILTCVEHAGIKALSAEIKGLALQRLVTFLHPDWLQEIDVVLDIHDHSIDIHIFKQQTIVFTRSMPISKANYWVDNSWNEDRYIYDLVNEIEKAHNFYRYSMDERETEFRRVIVTGSAAATVFQKLTDRLAYPVDRLNFTPLLPSSNFEAADHLDACGVAIGLALRGKEKAHRHSK